MKQDRGNGLGNSVTGAVIASVLASSASVALTAAGGGRTVRPLAILQSLIACISRWHSASSMAGGLAASELSAEAISPAVRVTWRGRKRLGAKKDSAAEIQIQIRLQKRATKRMVRGCDYVASKRKLSEWEKRRTGMTKQPRAGAGA